MQYKVGDGATVQLGSDQYPYTIIWINGTGTRLTLQQDKSIRLDNNGMSDCQSYDYIKDLDGEIIDVSLRKDGKYRVSNSKQRVTLGVRRKYHDFSF